MSLEAFPWLSLLVTLPGAGALLSLRLAAGPARRLALGVTGLTLFLALAPVLVGDRRAAVDPLDPGLWLVGRPVLVLDELSALLLPFGALLFAVVLLMTPRLVRQPRSVPRALAAETVILGTFACRDAVLLAALWGLGIWLLDRELADHEAAGAAARRLVRVYLSASLGCLLAGVGIGHAFGDHPVAATLAGLLILVAVMIRKGIVPLHSWLPVLFETAPLPAALLFTTPQIGTYMAARLLVPDAPAWILAVVGGVSLLTAVYAAGLGLVQDDGRRAFGWVFTSQSALVLAGLEGATLAGLAGALSLWLSSSLALVGLGMTLCVLEARRGDVSLARHHGGHESTPMLAASFLLLGLCTVGFPGTLGFVGSELLVYGTVEAHPQVGVAAIVATVLNSITVMRAYFRLFCGARSRSNPALQLRWRERLGFALLVGVLVVGGVFPQPILTSRHRAGEALLVARRPLARDHTGPAPPAGASRESAPVEPAAARPASP